MLFSPKDVAQQAGNEALAAAFEGKEAIKQKPLAITR